MEKIELTEDQEFQEWLNKCPTHNFEVMELDCGYSIDFRITRDSEEVMQEWLDSKE